MSKHNYTLEGVQADVTNMVSRDLAPNCSQEQLNVMAYIGLAEEAGEVAGTLKRRIRNQRGRADQLRSSTEALQSEVGDTLWYLAMICSCEGISLNDAWEITLKKLEARYGE